MPAGICPRAGRSARTSRCCAPRARRPWGHAVPPPSCPATRALREKAPTTSSPSAPSNPWTPPGAWPTRPQRPLCSVRSSTPWTSSVPGRWPRSWTGSGPRGPGRGPTGTPSPASWPSRTAWPPSRLTAPPGGPRTRTRWLTRCASSARGRASTRRTRAPTLGPPRSWDSTERRLGRVAADMICTSEVIFEASGRAAGRPGGIATALGPTGPA
mmetsp:Transcript_16783/g.56375  ORF Transcript_16783/g.56375 Transcript_16783/m.56375 type:complete len:213 (-) Transcript_16783:74-712(-)